MPEGRDQHYNSERVASAGVGPTLHTDAPAADIAKALTELLTEPAARHEASCFAGDIIRLGGGHSATERKRVIDFEGTG
jgi:UDP:flavonoid glycosyltransferase YjiC (YdhE family)